MWPAYAQSTGTITDALDRLQQHIEQVPAQLTALSETQLTERLPGKWSRREVIGHLIDSALNNLKRFTDAQFAQGTYVIQGYDQTKLVVANQYQQLPLSHLLTLWSSLNTQILYVANAIPTETLARPIQVGNTTSQTLGWLIEDYIAHLEHHLQSLV